MKTVRQLFILRETEGTAGVELEIEGANLPIVQDDKWRTENDGSLANGGLEYVLRNPMKTLQIKEALNELKETFNRNNAVIKENVYAGTHVHINVQKLTMKQLFTFMTLYYCLEHVLLHWCGETRTGNHFCLSGSHAEGGPEKLIRIVQNNNWNGLKNDNIRYGSMNPCSIPKYGSLEFRGMRSTKNFDHVYRWTCMLVILKKTSLKYNNPVDILVEFSKLGATEFAKKMMGNKFSMVKDVPHFEEKVYEGVRIAQDLAFQIDWDALDPQQDNPFA